MENIIKIFEENKEKQDVAPRGRRGRSRARKSLPEQALDIIETRMGVPYYIYKSINDPKEDMHFNEDAEMSDEENNILSRDLFSSRDKIESFTKNLLDRNDYTTLSFEDELKLYLHNLKDCRTQENTLIHYIKTFITSLVQFYLSEYDISRALYEKLEKHNLEGSTWEESYEKLGLLLAHHKNTNRSSSFNEVAMLLGRKLEIFSDGVEQYHIDKAIREYPDISVILSHYMDYDEYLKTMQDKEVIFIISHGSEDEGLFYYDKCNRNEGNFITSCDIQTNFKNAKFVFLLGCTKQPYENLRSHFDHFSIPKEPSGAFEFGEMFVKSFMKTYRVEKNIEMAIKSGELSGKLFKNKAFAFDIVSNPCLA